MILGDNSGPGVYYQALRHVLHKVMGVGELRIRNLGVIIIA